MECKVTRIHKTKDGIFSKMVLSGDDVDLEFWTVEHAYKTSQDTYEPKVPPGKYTCTRYDSPSHGYELFVVNGVTNHTMIEIHIGCFNEDSDGCFCLGDRLVMSAPRPMVTNSRISFREFMGALKGVDSFILTVI